MERVIKRLRSAKKDDRLVGIAIRNGSVSAEVLGNLESINCSKDMITLEILGVKSEVVIMIKLEDITNINFISENRVFIEFLCGQKIILDF